MRCGGCGGGCGGGNVGGGGEDWGDAGLGDVFAPRRGAPINYGQDSAYDAPPRGVGRNAMAPDRGGDFQWSGNLDAVLPARDRLPPNVARAFPRDADAGSSAMEVQLPRGARGGEDEYGGSGDAGGGMGANRAGDSDWGGMSLGDALGKPRRRTSDNAGRGGGARPASRGPPSTSSADQPEPHVPVKKAEAWDAGGMGRFQFNGNFDHAEEEDADPPQTSFPSRANNRSRAPPPVDDVWGGQSLADAFAPKKPSPSSQGGGCGGGGAAVSSGSGPARAAARGGGAPNATVAAECSKSAEEIVTWLRTLPESHVPEKSRENLIAIVEDHGHDGSSFSKYVQQVPPEVCAPKHAMKLKAAWGNVLKEQEAKAIAMSNLSNAPRQKATMIVI